MDSYTRRTLPLLGALLVAEELVTQEQLEACLLIQTQDYPGEPLGNILLRCGYITQDDLAHIVRLQQELKSSILETLDEHVPPPVDLTALLLAHDASRIVAMLQKLGVAVFPVDHWSALRDTWEQQQPDLILIDPGLMDDAATLPAHMMTPVLLLPPLQTLEGARLPQWLIATLLRFIMQVREQRRQRQALERLQHREFELNVVDTMSRNIAAAHSPRDAMSQLMLTISDLFGVEAGTLFRLDHAANQLVFEVVFGPADDMLIQQRLPIDRGIAGWVVRHREPLLIPDVRRDPRFEGSFDRQTGFQTHSVLCVPLIALGEVRGVLQLINKHHGEFTDRDLLLLRIIAALGGLAEVLATFTHDAEPAS